MLRINIHHKITIIFCLILVVVLFGVFTYLDHTLKSYVFNRIQTALTKEVLLAKMFLEKDFPGYPKFKEIDDIADQASEQLKTRVTIIGLNGVVLGDSDLNGEGLKDVENHLYRPEVQEALRNKIGQSRRFSTTVQKEMLYIAAVFGKDSPEGIVRLSLPLVEIETVSRKLKKILFFALFGAFLIAVPVSYMVLFLLSKPIKEISSAAENIAAGNYSKKIHIRTNDEIGDLASTFNYMTEEIRSKIAEITSNRIKFEAVLLSMFDGIMVVDSKSAIVLMNKALQDMFLVENEPLGKKPLEIIRNVEIQDVVDKTLAGEKNAVETRELSIIMPKEKVLIVHGTPIVHNGQKEGAVLAFHDVTEIKRLERVRKDFVANVSHELRTPASNIKGFVETLNGGALEDKENARDFLEIIEKNSERLERLIDDLLDLSRIETGKIKLNLKMCSVRFIADKVIKELSSAAREKSIQIENNIGSVSKVSVDETMISQVFFNLIDNEVKYTDNSGKIIISAVEEKDFIKVSISDTGIGISERDMPRVFERFYCADKARSRQVGGTGLGLSIVKHIVEEHGGKVFIESLLGHGSVFAFTLPKK